MIWLAVRIAAAVALVVVPFGYATAGSNGGVAVGAGCGLAIGAAVGLSGNRGPRPWTGILVGSLVGIGAVLASTVAVTSEALVGVHLILSAGWVVVLFAAVMTSIGPKLDQIARRHAEDDS